MLTALFVSLLSLSLSFSGVKHPASLPVTAFLLVLELLLPAPGDHVPVHLCQKSSLSSVTSSSCCSLRRFCSPE